MVKRLFERVGSVLFLMAVAVLGTMATVWNFTQIYATKPLVWWIAVLSAVCGAFVCVGIKLMGRAGFIGRLLIFAALTALVAFRFDVIAGGFAYIFNYAIDSINYYYKSEIYYILLTDGMLKKANQELTVMLLCALTGGWYMSVLLRRRGVLLTGIVSMLSYFIPASVEEAPSVPTLVSVLCFIVCVTVHGNLPREKNELRARKSGILAMLWVILPSICIMFGAVKIVPEDKFEAADFYDKLAGKIVFSVKDIQNIIEQKGIGNNNSNNDSPDFARGEIGKTGSVTYSDVPVLYVRAPKSGGTLYLKTFQAAQYTKRRWKELDSSVYREYSDMFDELCAQEDMPLLMEYNAVASLVKDKAEEIKSAAFDITVMQYESRGSSYIPMSAVAVDGTSIDKIAKTDMNITLETDTVGAQNVYHRYSLFEWRNFSSLYSLVKSGAEHIPDERSSAGRYRRFVYENYLDTNTSCADRIKNELISDIMQGEYDISQPDGKARFILDTIAFFNREYDYTLSPGVTPSTKDYVGYFLFEKKRGLCAHFASAAVMIFRCAGIPARYVEGFVVPGSLYTQQADYRRQARLYEDGDLETEMWQYYDIEVTDRYAHAWAEVYIDGIGWMTVDPTPGYGAGYMDSQDWYDNSSTDSPADQPMDDSEAETDGMMADESTQDSLEETAEDTTDDIIGGTSEDNRNTESEGYISVDNRLPGDAEATGESNGMGTAEDIGEAAAADEETTAHFDFAAAAGKVYGVIKPVLHILLTALKVIAIPFIIVLFLVIRQKYMEQKRVRLYNNACGLYTGERIAKIMLYYEKMLKAANIRMDPDMDFSDLINNAPVKNMDSQKAAMIVEKAMFSGTFPAEDDTMYVMAYVSELRKEIYASKNIFGKLYFKYILAL